MKIVIKNIKKLLVNITTSLHPGKFLRGCYMIDVFKHIFKFFKENNLISDDQSGFRPGGSCISQLLSITRKIYQSFQSLYFRHI